MRPVLRLTLALTAGALAVAAVGLAAPAGATASHTVRAVVRPVHANGTPVAGYTVTHERIPGFTCLDASPVAVDRGIDFCGFSATYTMACWRSKNHTALCLRDPLRKQLVRIRYSGTFARLAAPKHPIPQALRLAGGNVCLVRDGGAWGWVTGHPSWSGAYGCTHDAIYGPGDGINQSVQPWRVHVVRDPGGPGQEIVTKYVRKAWFVGTAA